MEQKKRRKRNVQWWIVGGFTILLAAFTFVVWREQKAGGSCYQKNAAQNAESNNPSTVPNGGQALPSEGTSPNQANQPTSDAESYFCRLIAPTNLPTDYLVIVGVGGVLAALATLKIISRQARSMRFQTTILRDNVAALVASERAYIDGEVEIDAMLVRRYRIRITNHGKTPAHILGYQVSHGCSIEGKPFSVAGLESQYVRNLHILLGSQCEKVLEDAINMDDIFRKCTETASDVFRGVFCVTVRYEDIITKELKDRKDRETFFMYEYRLLTQTLERINTQNKYS